MKRPIISNITNGESLKSWYWLKEELVAFCKANKLDYSGVKFEILEKVANFLDGNDTLQKDSLKASSKFDWHSAFLNTNTIITDSYKNSQNVRKFFMLHCSESFHFSIPFMHFMRTNIGKHCKMQLKNGKDLMI